MARTAAIMASMPSATLAISPSRSPAPRSPLTGAERHSRFVRPVSTFTSPTAFYIVFNGTPYFYDTSTVSKTIFNGVTGKFSQVVFDDIVATDDYTATQSLTATDLVRSGGVTFEFDSNNAKIFYAYVADASSTATITVANNAGGSNFYADATNNGYSYIADPTDGIYSELSGSAQTVTGTAGTTYAYLYSTSHATAVGDPSGSSITVGSVTTTVSSFPQVYIVGTTDGTDTITLHTKGGGFVAQPTFSYVAGTFDSASFWSVQFYAANVTAQATNATDTAFFYSYPGDTFNGTTGASGSNLTGTATGSLAPNLHHLRHDGTGFQSVTVQESGSGTDMVNLSSPGSGTFTSTPTVGTLVVGSVTVFTVKLILPRPRRTTFVHVAAQSTWLARETARTPQTCTTARGTNTLPASGIPPRSSATLAMPGRCKPSPSRIACRERLPNPRRQRHVS